MRLTGRLSEHPGEHRLFITAENPMSRRVDTHYIYAHARLSFRPANYGLGRNGLYRELFTPPTCHPRGL